MDSIDELRKRIDRIEERLDAVIGVVNRLIEDVFEPEYVKKIDRLVDYGEQGTSDSKSC